MTGMSRWWTGLAWRRAGGAACGWRGVAWLVGAVALVTLRVPRTAELTAEFPQHSPTTLAHFLADFTNHPKLYTHLSGAWWIEHDVSNITTWRYVVGYACGGRCGGRVVVEHTTLAADAHRLTISDARCTQLPLLPWPQICEHTDVKSVITARGGGGARLREEARSHCGLPALLGAAGGCSPDAARRQHLRALRDALAAAADTK